MNIIKNIATHNTGGLGNDYYAKTQHLTWQHIDNAHRERWNDKSSLGLYGGYNFYIQANGEWKQFRAIGEETMAQKGHNFDTISFCFAGNFASSERPNEAQKETFKKLYTKIINKDYRDIAIYPNTEINVSVSSIHHHRFYQQGTECDCLLDSYWRDIMLKTQHDNSAVIAFIKLLISLKIISGDFIKILPFLGKKKLGKRSDNDREGCGNL